MYQTKIVFQANPEPDKNEIKRLQRIVCNNLLLNKTEKTFSLADSVHNVIDQIRPPK